MHDLYTYGLLICVDMIACKILRCFKVSEVYLRRRLIILPVETACNERIHINFLCVESTKAILDRFIVFYKSLSARIYPPHV